MMAGGAFLVLISLSHWYFRYQALSLSAELLAEYKQTEQEDTSLLPTHIRIPWFVDAAIEKQVYSDNRWTISAEKVSYLSQSARPTTNGNVIIYGHNTREILGNIRALKGNEIITLTLENGMQRDYIITTIDEVDPHEVKYLQPTTQETLTLYTCSGFLDQKRFIVQAVPKILE